MLETAETTELLEIEVLEKAAECLKTLAHPHRLRMIQLLLRGPNTVGDLATACQIPSNVASEHLRLLKDRGFLNNERQGRNVYYQIAELGLANIMQCVTMRYGSK